MRRLMAVQRPSSVRSAAFRSRALSLANAFSMGLKSGLQGGRSSRLAPAASIRARTLAPLWLDRLSRITTSPGRSSGTRTFSRLQLGQGDVGRLGQGRVDQIGMG